MPETFKVITYNIHRGLSAVKKREILQQIVMILELSKADVVFLQEVWQESGVSDHQLEALCRIGWRHHLFRANVVFPSGSQGNALLSRFGVTAWHHVDVSVRGHEPRGFLHADLQMPSGAPVAVICAHFGLRRAERHMQSLWLQQFIDRHFAAERPLIIAGDFNDWLGHPEAVVPNEQGFFEVMRATTGKFGRTFPSFAPVLPLDRIYFRNLRLETARVVRRLPPVTGMSDHLPVEAVFSIVPA